YLHSPDYAVAIEETLQAMDKIVRAGKVRYFGVSNYAAWQVCQMLWLCERENYTRPVVSQPMYNLLARAIEQEFVPFCQTFTISMVVYNPLARGLLTSVRRSHDSMSLANLGTDRSSVDRYQHPAYLEAVEELRATAKRAGRSLVDVAINWLLHHTAAD